ncbi:MAG TPA: TetR/AcrR family transcriptional regulator [Jatrophihabitantaceae bacterium]|nr:TetR/AcrR family transcriptional regulator [Jatrophihabitantaceae bacterium]
MSSEPRLRADARENREKLVRAARAAFAAGETVSLDAIARAAGVGIGTLYRHFPNREALVEAVYRDQVDELRVGAGALLASHPPVAALRAWMDLFADWADAKRGMVSALATLRSRGTLDMDASRREISSILGTLVSAGIASGELRPDVDPADLRSLLAGILAAATDRDQVARLFDLAIDSLRPRG